MKIGTRVEFIGDPEYFRGRKATVVRNTFLLDQQCECFLIEFDGDKTLLLTQKHNVKILQHI